MINESQASSAIPTTSDLEFIRLQLGQAITTYQAQLTLLIELITVLIIANATVVGYALSTQLAGIMLIGALFPVMIVVLQLLVYKRSLPIIFTAISIEQKYGIANMDWLASTFVSATISPDYFNQLKTIALIQDSSERMKQLRNLPIPLFKGIYSYIITLAIVLVTLFQIIAPFFLWHYGWRMF